MVAVFKPGSQSAFCASVPYWSMSSSPMLFPTIECSFCRSLWSPKPFTARCSRMMAIPRLLPSRPPCSLGNGYEKIPAAIARRFASASSDSQASLGNPSRSQSVELAGSSKFCVEPQFAAPPRGQSSGELSVMPSLSSSESQASPCASPSVFSWRGFTSLGQLSETSGTPSLSESAFIDGSKAQTKLSHPPVLDTLLVPFVMVLLPDGPA